MGRFGNFMLGLVCGYGVGGVIGLLLAPTSGDQFRKNIVDYKDQVITDVKATVDERQEQLRRELAYRRSSDIKLEQS